MISNPRITVRDVDNVKVVRLDDRLLLDDKTVHDVAKEIAAVLRDDGSPIHLVLDFSGVELLSSSFLSKLLMLKRRINASRGTLRLRGMSYDIQDFLRRSKLDRLFQIDLEKPAARVSF